MDDNVYKLNVTSGHIGDSDKTIYITEQNIIFDKTIIDFENIKNIELSDYNPTDWNKIGIILSNIFTSIIITIILSLSIWSASLLMMFFILIGLLITNYMTEDIYSYVSIKEPHTEYLIGIKKEDDLKQLFNTIESHSSHDITYDDIKSAP